MPIKLVIPGRPVPAVRMTQKSKFKNPLTHKYLDYKNTVGWIGKSKINVPLPKSFNASVTMNFYVYRGHAMDIDNLCKSILDSLNGIAWEDDKQVVEIIARRHAANGKDQERAEVEIKTV